MRHTVRILWCVLLSALPWAQPAPPHKLERSAIQRARNVLVSSLDSSLPKVSLEFFLKNEGAGAPIHWRVKDCDEKTANTARVDAQDSIICVEADIDLKDLRSVTVLVSVGTLKRGLIDMPALVSVATTDSSGMVHQVRHLGDLPMELHRPPGRLPLPKDPAVPVGAIRPRIQPS